MGANSKSSGGAFERLARAMAELDNPGEIGTLLNEVLTPSELHDLSLRWEILELLAAGASQRRIASELGVSLCKITRGAKYFKSPASVAARLARKAARRGATAAAAQKVE